MYYAPALWRGSIEAITEEKKAHLCVAGGIGAMPETPYGGDFWSENRKIFSYNMIDNIALSWYNYHE